MRCFLTVLKNIGMFAALLAVVVAGIAVIGLATALTVYALGIGPQSAWPLVIFGSYFVIALGAVLGIEECHG